MEKSHFDQYKKLGNKYMQEALAKGGDHNVLEYQLLRVLNVYDKASLKNCDGKTDNLKISSINKNKSVCYSHLISNILAKIQNIETKANENYFRIFKWRKTQWKPDQYDFEKLEKYVESFFECQNLALYYGVGF